MKNNPRPLCQPQSYDIIGAVGHVATGDGSHELAPPPMYAHPNKKKKNPEELPLMQRQLTDDREGRRGFYLKDDDTTPGNDVHVEKSEVYSYSSASY